MSVTTSTYPHTYQPTWEEFLRHLGKLSPRQKRQLHAEATTSGTLGIVLAAQRTYVNTHSRADYGLRRARETAAAVEAARMTVRNPDAPRQKVLSRALASLGPARRITRSEEEKAQARGESKRFFKSTQHEWKKKRILLEQYVNFDLWLLMHPAEIRTTAADLEAWEQLRMQVRHLTGCPPVRFAPKDGFMPVGMTRERALQIAESALSR